MMEASTESTRRVHTVFVAPHLVTPIRNGADVYIDGLAREVSRRVGLTMVVGADALYAYEVGRWKRAVPIASAPRSKPVAAIRTLVFRSHYLVERFQTPAFERAAEDVFRHYDPEHIVYSFCCSVRSGAHRAPTGPDLVLTHNDEVTWFQQRAAASGWLGRRVAQRSLDWLERFIRDVPPALRFGHVNATDEQRWQRHGLEAMQGVVPIGVDVPTEMARPGLRSRVTIAFVGSLGVQMNVDALRHFAERFEQPLRQRYASLDVHVIGSAPSADLLSLAASHNWRVSADVSHGDLRASILDATVTILPFAEAVGSKLKLLESLALGVPVLATPAGVGSDVLLPTPCVVSDNPCDWVAGMETIRSKGVSAGEISAMRAVAEGQSWGHSVDALLALLAR
jgi:glycosyltransferase involved in cell wall biosynthesis